MVQLHIYPDDQLDGRMHVRPDGTIDMPLLGPTSVSGLTVDGAAERIRRQLTGKYYKHPQVEVRVVEYVAHRAYVLGAVNHPGAYPVAPGARILDLVQLAGGLTNKSSGFVFLFDDRAVATDSGPLPRRIPLSKILEDGDAAANVVVPDGATVYVSAAAGIYVLGAVAHPGMYPVSEGRTLLRAISVAGGLTDRANEGKVWMYHAGSKQRISADLDEIIHRRARDLNLTPGDVVYVPNRVF